MYKIFINIFLLLSGLSGFAQTTVVLDWQTNNMPDVTYKRGISAPGQNGFFDSPQMRDFVDYQSSIGMNIFNGIRNLFKDPETNEFYFENGEFKNQQIPAFTDIRKYTSNAGFELISQVGGTPRNSGYEFDTSYRKTPDSTFYEPDADFAPIPAEGESMQEFQRNFTEWAINADKAVGEDFHSIWIGTQEIAHTIGFKDGIVSGENKKLNIRRWVNYWKPISDSLRAAGAKTGGIQLNSSNIDIYEYAVDYMVQQNLHLDFITYQFYQWSDTADLTRAVEATERYSLTYPGTKLIVDRGGYSKLLPEEVSPEEDAQAVIYHLVGELGLMNHADHVYAYSLDRSVNGMDNSTATLLWKTKEWINTIGHKRCSLTGLPDGVDGFAVHDGQKISIALWNRGADTKDFEIQLDDVFDSPETIFSVKHARSKSFISSAVIYDGQQQIIRNISLRQYDFILMDIEFDYPLKIAVNEPGGKVTMYPNPAKDFVRFRNITGEASVKAYSLDGKLTINKRISAPYGIDISSLSSGIYTINIQSENQNVNFKLIKN